MIFLLIILLLSVVPAWAFDAAVVRVPLNTTTGLQNINFGDFGENCTATPCAAVFIVTTGISDNILAADAMMSLGFTDGSSQRVVAVHDNDVTIPTDGMRETRTDRVLETLETTGVTGAASFYDWQSNGLRLDVTDAPPAAYLLTVLLMGGTGFQAKVGTIAASATLDGAVDITSPAFQPDAVIISTARLATDSSSTYLFSAGVAVNDGANTQGSIGCYSEHNASTTNIRAVSSTLYAGQVLDGGGLDMALQIGGWDAAGFTATSKGVPIASNWPFLAMKFGGADSAVFDIDTRITTGATSHALGFRPLAGMIFGTRAQAYDVEEADDDASQCMLSLYAGTGQYSHANTMQDGLTAAAKTTSRSNDDGIMMLSANGTCTAGTCLRGFIILDPTALTIDYYNVYSDAVRKWIGFAIQDAGVVAARRRGTGLLQ